MERFKKVLGKCLAGKFPEVRLLTVFSAGRYNRCSVCCRNSTPIKPGEAEVSVQKVTVQEEHSAFKPVTFDTRQVLGQTGTDALVSDYSDPTGNFMLGFHCSANLKMFSQFCFELIILCQKTFFRRNKNTNDSRAMKLI